MTTVNEALTFDPSLVPEPCPSCFWQYPYDLLVEAGEGKVKLDPTPTHLCGAAQVRTSADGLCGLSLSTNGLECGKPRGWCGHCTVCAEPVMALVLVTHDGVMWNEWLCVECLVGTMRDQADEVAAGFTPEYRTDVVADYWEVRNA